MEGYFSLDAVVLCVGGGIQIKSVVDELSYGTCSVENNHHIIVVNEDISTCESVLQEVTKSVGRPSLKSVTGIDTTLPLPGCFNLKKVLDDLKSKTFVIVTHNTNRGSTFIPTLLATVDAIFPSTVYQAKVKLYGGGYVDTQSMLMSMGRDVQVSALKKCSECLTSLSLSVQIEFITANCICEKTFVHGFSTRKGGCSSYPSQASLNLAHKSQDPPIVVNENRRRLLNAAGVPSHRFELGRAVHGNTVWVVGTSDLPEYDAIVCDQPGVMIAAPAADCVTIIFADASRRVCAVAHSGWKGTLSNVCGATIDVLVKQFGCSVCNIKAAIGPSIGMCCYEVGEDVSVLFSNDSLLNECVMAVEGKQKCHLNLQQAVKLQLLAKGLLSGGIDDRPSKFCTFCNEDLFFSYRRDGRPFGTHVGFIALK